MCFGFEVVQYLAEKSVVLVFMRTNSNMFSSNLYSVELKLFKYFELSLIIFLGDCSEYSLLCVIHPPSQFVTIFTPSLCHTLYTPCLLYTVHP